MRLLLLFLLASVAAGRAGSLPLSIPAPPSPAREFRGAWVATVCGCDFPFEAGDPAEKQKKELLGIIQRASDLKLNALIFQVRPAGDAFYKSSIEPWSPFLTGLMGKAPDVDWDPLEFAINECHIRGLEVHAWFNPFRALSGSQFSPGGNHVLREHPEWCMGYGPDVWMDPGIAGVRDRAKRVILDVVRRYDVDGVHVDDYFYPYPITKKGVAVEFPDHLSFDAYVKGGGKLDRGEWRRSNIDAFVQETYDAVKREKSWVRFGISPFGIWRPNFPEGVGKGALDPYTDLSADSLKWLQNGWCDYFAPQLYWPIKPANLSFTSLFNWWKSQNTQNRHIWPGMSAERLANGRQSTELLQEINVTRQIPSIASASGHIHWNFSALNKNKGKLADQVNKGAYGSFALPPASPWLGNIVPPAPSVTRDKAGAKWEVNDITNEDMVKWWLVQTFEGGEWSSRGVLPSVERVVVVPLGAKAVAIRGIGPTGMEGDASVVR